MCFVLYPVESTQPAGTSQVLGKTGNAVQSDRGLFASFKGHGNLDAIRKAAEDHVQVRVLPFEMLERFLACRDD